MEYEAGLPEGAGTPVQDELAAPPQEPLIKKNQPTPTAKQGNRNRSLFTQKPFRRDQSEATLRDNVGPFSPPMTTLDGEEVNLAEDLYLSSSEDEQMGAPSPGGLLSPRGLPPGVPLGRGRSPLMSSTNHLGGLQGRGRGTPFKSPTHPAPRARPGLTSPASSGGSPSSSASSPGSSSSSSSSSSQGTSDEEGQFEDVADQEEENTPGQRKAPSQYEADTRRALAGLEITGHGKSCLLYTSPSPRDA